MELVNQFAHASGLNISKYFFRRYPNIDPNNCNCQCQIFIFVLYLKLISICLQRDFSLLSKVLLSGRTVSLCLCNDSTIKEIKKTVVLGFIWKHRTHKLKRDILSTSRGDGGGVNFADTINTSKVNWLKRCLMNPVVFHFKDL